MINKDLTVTVTNEEEGLTLTLKTVSALGVDKVAVSGDPGLFQVDELEGALKLIKEFK